MPTSWPPTAPPSAIPSPTSASSRCSSSITLFIVIRASRKNTTAAEFFTGGPLVHRPAERHRDLRRLPVGGQLPRHRGRHRRVRLRRLPLLDRLPGRLAGRAAAGRRIAAQHRQIHDGRRAELPAASNGRCGWPRRPRRWRSACSTCWRRWRAQAAWSRCCSTSRADVGQAIVIAVVGVLMIALRADRRDEGHHLGADHQGRPADRRRRADDGDGAGQVRVQLLRDPRRRADCGLGRHHRRPSPAATCSRPARSTAHR